MGKVRQCRWCRTFFQVKKMDGYIKLHRSILGWEHFSEPAVLQVFIYLLLTANRDGGDWQGHEYKSGETFVSIRTICKDLKMSTKTAVKILRTLEDSGEIKRQRLTQKLSKTAIVNFAKFQSDGNSCVFHRETQDTPSVFHRETQKALCVFPGETRQEYIYNNTVVGARAREENFFQSLGLNTVEVSNACAKLGIAVPEFMAYAKQVASKWRNDGKVHESWHDYITHLINTIKIKIRSYEQSKKNNGNNGAAAGSTYEEREAVATEIIASLTSKGEEAAAGVPF